MTRPLRHSVYSALSVNKCLVGPAIHNEFVGLVLGATEITDLIIDQLYQAIFYSAREGSLYVNDKDPSSVNEDISNTFNEESSGDNNISQTQSDLFCGGSGTADSSKENMLPSQGPSSSEIWDSGSTTADEETS
ncbi:hypothetical protein RRF57_012982 [Xylaria bambusicola]|uniref:Uncharacterized protein n=1 Tax=Xylaria bambusicola TaxID=326684 RepID=A0AAN7UQZ3_9PEZI